MKKKVLIIQYVTIALMVLVTVEFVAYTSFKHTPASPKASSQKIHITRHAAPFTVENASLTGTITSTPTAM